jgi:hypothetical protein
MESSRLRNPIRPHGYVSSSLTPSALIDVRIPINKILFPEPVSAGMDLETLVILSQRMRKTNVDFDPIIVRAEGDLFTLTDGRHRVVAAMMAGRKDILARYDVP